MLSNCGSGDSWDSLGLQEIKSVSPKGNQSWIFTGISDAEADAPILWAPNAKSPLIWKDSDAEKNWRKEENGATRDEMIGWHHWLSSHKFEQTQGDSEFETIGPAVVHGVAKSWTWFSDWTTTKKGFLGDSSVKNLPANAGHLGSIQGLGRSPEEGNSSPLQYSCLENSMERGTWWATVHGVAKSWTQLSN